MSGNHRDIDSIFLAAAALPADKRPEYVAEACGEDHDLKERVERLLDAKSVTSDFLESPAQELAATANSLNHENAGDTVGRYKLLQKIGEGGMGTVFMAEQIRPVSRRVALKIIKPGMDSKQVLARFEAERQALAMMDHPNIAKVLDAGTTESGRPYFVMELVKGLPVTTYCDENKLSVHQRLELFIQICQAMQHAHQKGIIHRDLKPGNVLVAKYDDEAVPKIIDFGVAKAISQRLTEKTMFTEFGQIVGTLEYMSPEQAQLNQLDVDTRSDIYSLGVLLYELLTGETPFDGKRLRSSAFDEVMRILREEEPPRPSNRISTLGEKASSVSSSRACDMGKLGGFLRGDIDWIVMKSMEKDRSRRYDSASAFANDIQRHLSNDTVVARPPTIGYRMAKIWSRNRAAVSTVAIVLLAILFGIGSFAWSLSKQQQAFDELRVQLIEQAFEYALIGDLKSFDEALTGAKTTGVSKDWQLTLEAVAALHQGQNEKAHGLFTDALQSDPSNTTAWAMKSIAIKHLGNELEWEEHMSALRDHKPRELYSEMDKLSLAYAKFYVNFADCAKEIAPILEEKKTWFVARALSAAVIAEAAHSNGKPELMKQAIEKLRVPYIVAPDNPFVNAISLFIHKARLISFGKPEEEDWLSREITNVAARAKQQKDYHLAQMLLAEYYSVSDQAEKAQQTWRRLLNGRGFMASVAMAECCKNGEFERIRETRPADPESQIAKACALATSGDPGHRDFARQTFEQLVDEQTPAYIRLKLLQLLFLLRDDDLIAKSKKWKIIETNRAEMYGDIRQRILLDFAGQPVSLDVNSEQPIEQLLVNYYRALQSYANGDLPKAIEYISEAVDANVGSVEWYWANAPEQRWTQTSPEE